MIRMFLAFVAILFLAACQTVAPVEPKIVIKEVLVPQPVSCVPKDFPDEPKYVDSDEALRKAAGPEDRYQLVTAGREQRVARSRETEPVLRACRDP